MYNLSLTNGSYHQDIYSNCKIQQEQSKQPHKSWREDEQTFPQIQAYRSPSNMYKSAHHHGSSGKCKSSDSESPPNTSENVPLSTSAETTSTSGDAVKSKRNPHTLLRMPSTSASMETSMETSQNLKLELPYDHPVIPTWDLSQEHKTFIQKDLPTLVSLESHIQ